MFDIAPNTMILSGVVGSTAYGLSGENSDIDKLGIYAAPTRSFHGLHPPVGKSASIVKNDPDVTLHEVGKFAHLCLGGNPTVMELLWLSEYEAMTPLGQELINIRESFLSAPRVRDAYLGYATQQFHKLTQRGDGSFGSDLRKRTAKHARHLMRLCYQGYNLYSLGRLAIKLENPQAFIDFGEEVADGNLGVASDLIKRYEGLYRMVVPAIPERADEEVVENWLYKVRETYFKN